MGNRYLGRAGRASTASPGGRRARSLLPVAALALLLALGGTRPAGAEDIEGVVFNPGTGHYYKWVQNNGTWSSAKSGAQALGGYLATVTTDAERAWIDANIRPANTACWFGATDEVTEGTWTWVSGEAWSYAFWNGGEPNNSGNEDYLMANSNGTWNDIYGTYSLPGYVVEWDTNPNIPPPPLAPTGLTAAFTVDGTVLLEWTDNSSNEDWFELERRAGAAGNWVTDAYPGQNAESHEDTDQLAPSTEYFYRVRAVNLGGVSAYTNEVSVSTPAIPRPPAPPTNALVAASSPYSVTIRWQDNSDDETRFEVHRRSPPGEFAYLGMAATDVTEYTDSGLPPDAAFVYGIRGVNFNGPSGMTEVAGATNPTLEVSTLRATLSDSAKTGKDKIKVLAGYAPLEGVSDGEFDPVAEGITLRGGPDGGPLTIIVPPADGAWKVRKGKATWKGPPRTVPKYKVQVDPANRLVTFSVSRIEMTTAAANPMRVSVRIGDDAGRVVEEWETKKAGKYRR